jgi:hypothetical protein
VTGLARFECITNIKLILGTLEYIQQLASAGAANATNNATNVQTKDKLTTMLAEIKKLTATITLMATKLNDENKNSNAGRGTGKGSRYRKSKRPQMKKLGNMGIYCHSHGSIKLD